MRAAIEWAREVSHRLNQDYENAEATDQNGWHKIWQDAVASNTTVEILEQRAKALGINLKPKETNPPSPSS